MQIAARVVGGELLRRSIRDQGLKFLLFPPLLVIFERRRDCTPLLFLAPRAWMRWINTLRVFKSLFNETINFLVFISCSCEN